MRYYKPHIKSQVYPARKDPKCEISEYEFWDMAEVWKEIGTKERRQRIDWSSDWYGADSKRIDYLLEHGDKKAVEEAQSLAQSFEAKIDVENYKPTPINSVVGGSVSVGAYVAGIPNCMRRIIPAETEISNTVACRIFLPMDSYAGLSSKQVKTYGTICLALAMKMQTLRPVELFSYSIGKYTVGKYRYRGSIVRLGTTPLALSQALAFPTNLILQRGLIYNEQDCRAHGKIVSGSGSGFYDGNVFDCLDANPSDIICPIINHHIFTTIQKDPVSWVEKMIQTSFENRDLEQKLNHG